ncbi:metal-dependent transcriptional regulator [Microcella daejeonensis]|uniref:metal-dependent transcriptional regulator n=1 Tax=Microcella daejeonensis TaxID=2994971 RepID=UPI00226EE124|nr:metal-dependent transcriptional regulator [Microcella daejeonensis]WAB83797.1 metal-dependent transcriptional regulator [Microcella daejeonensis]
MVESGVRAESSGAASTAADDYLKTIYSHTEWQPKPITPGELAVRLGLAPSSVTEMVKKLGAAGLVDHRPYAAIRLTAAGEQRALAMLRRHRLIETWLVAVHGYGWDEVHDEAEVLEHALSDRLLAAIDVQLGHPRRDPHGDLIPAPDGTIERPAAVRLDLAAAGARGRVVRLSDRDPAGLRELERLGIALDAELEVTASSSGGVVVRGAAQDAAALPALPASLAAAVWITEELSV